MPIIEGYSISLLALVVGICAAVVWTRSSCSRSVGVPPGPPLAGWLSGHLALLPSTKPWKVYTEWAHKYGPVLHLRAYNKRIILLSSMEDCNELLEKRSNLYSDRPTMGWDFNTVIMSYGPRWKRQRRLFQQMFSKVQSFGYRPEQTRKTNDMLHGLLTTPDDFRDHVQTVSAAIVMSATYGYDIQPKKDYYIEIAEDATLRISKAVVPGARLVNDVPILRYLPTWFPGTEFHKFASDTMKLTTQMKEVPLKWTKISAKLPSIQTEEDMITLQDFAATIYAAGADTLTAAIRTFFYVMAAVAPDAQRKAQEEIDRIVGRDRLPTYDDWEALPYTEAILREVLRWRPVLPIGVPHRVTDDDIYKGYLIPKGSLVISNVWALSRDPSVYKDPETFNPDRFFDEHGNLTDDDSDYVFGFGRRKCPGLHMGRATVWLSIATTLWAFNIGKAKDALGEDIPISGEYSDGMISSRSVRLPPGPPLAGWLSGHLALLPSTKPWKVYTEWAHKYGPVLHLRAYNKRIILLSSMEDCNELLEKRSNLYSDRPTMGWDVNTVIMPYGPRWKRQRRLFQQMFTKVPSFGYRPEQTRKVNDMLYGLLATPEDFRDHVQTVSAAIVMSATYGYDIQPKKDYFIEIAEDATVRISKAVVPGARLVNDVPILRHLPTWFPGAEFHKFAADTMKMTTQMKELPFKWTQKKMEAGEAVDCIVASKLPSCQTEEDIVTLQEFAATIYAAGADTTTAAMHTFFYIMAAVAPDAVQRKAQEEIDRVVGTDRLPTYDDWESLPYTEAIMREVLRWRPVLPLGVPHRVTDDDIYKGYLIPKGKPNLHWLACWFAHRVSQGSLVIPNVWALSRESSVYKDPETFNPDRFLDEDCNLTDDDSDYVFGFGRRKCPGLHIARATVWLSIATTLWAFNISKAKDAFGEDIPISGEYSDALKKKDGISPGLFASQTVLAALIGAFALYTALRSKSSPLRSLPLPPGPPVTNWLSGHLSILPSTQPWKVYTKWAERYGPVIHLRVYNQHDNTDLC
ncbi:hypothetical protein D9619_007168 [Psilocybe cf. subviscida]|uniref:Cytochrome P450 n=1 Tax=Psilocybe cf. subviscida TaxID=2480587 RepID=A0A8H5B239_9AGAR|nr:hypothetical protein D9619_007168 [Psilocybe cf. subviscida]